MFVHIVLNIKSNLEYVYPFLAVCIEKSKLYVLSFEYIFDMPNDLNKFKIVYRKVVVMSICHIRGLAT